MKGITICKEEKTKRVIKLIYASKWIYNVKAIPSHTFLNSFHKTTIKGFYIYWRENCMGLPCCSSGVDCMFTRAVVSNCAWAQVPNDTLTALLTLSEWPCLLVYWDDQKDPTLDPCFPPSPQHAAATSLPIFPFYHGKLMTSLQSLSPTTPTFRMETQI